MLILLAGLICILLATAAVASGEGGAGDAADGKGGQPDPKADPNAGKSAADNGGTATVSMTQVEFDKTIEDRLARAKKADRKAWEEEVAEAKKKAEMSEAERLKADKETAEQAVKDAHSKAGQRVIHAEARVAAIIAGIKPERLSYALRMADLSKIEVNDDGEPDATAIKSAIDQVVKDIPELAGSGNGAGRGGGDFTKPPAGGEALTAELIGKMPAEELKRRMPEVEAFYTAQSKGR